MFSILNDFIYPWTPDWWFESGENKESKWITPSDLLTKCFGEFPSLTWNHYDNDVISVFHVICHEGADEWYVYFSHHYNFFDAATDQPIFWDSWTQGWYADEDYTSYVIPEKVCW